MQVNEDGVLAFKQPFNVFFPLPLFALGNEVLISPFWSSIDVSRLGSIWYRQTRDPEDLALATSLIQKHATTAPSGFNASYLFIATWDRVHSSFFFTPSVVIIRYAVSSTSIHLMRLL